MSLVKDKTAKTLETLGSQLGVTNVFAAPRIEKVVVSVGTGRVNKDKERMKLIADRLAKITGQKAAPRPAKKAIAAFKTREGDVIGYQVTLRGKRMYDFLDKLLHVAIPRTRDFRGINRSAVDEMGNCTIGIREHTIFPETGDEDLRDVFGFAVTIVSSAKNREQGLPFFEHLGVPFKKEESK